jgi:hypothetical protein
LAPVATILTIFEAISKPSSTLTHEEPGSIVEAGTPVETAPSSSIPEVLEEPSASTPKVQTISIPEVHSISIPEVHPISTPVTSAEEIQAHVEEPLSPSGELCVVPALARNEEITPAVAEDHDEVSETGEHETADSSGARVISTPVEEILAAVAQDFDEMPPTVEHETAVSSGARAIFTPVEEILAAAKASDSVEDVLSKVEAVSAAPVETSVCAEEVSYDEKATAISPVEGSVSVEKDSTIVCETVAEVKPVPEVSKLRFRGAEEIVDATWPPAEEGSSTARGDVELLGAVQEPRVLELSLGLAGLDSEPSESVSEPIATVQVDAEILPQEKDIQEPLEGITEPVKDEEFFFVSEEDVAPAVEKATFQNVAAAAAVEAVGAVAAAAAVVAVAAVEAVEAVVAVEAVEAMAAVEAVEAVEAVATVEAVEAVVAAAAVEAVEAVAAVEAVESVAATAEEETIGNETAANFMLPVKPAEVAVEAPGNDFTNLPFGRKHFGQIFILTFCTISIQKQKIKLYLITY